MRLPLLLLIQACTASDAHSMQARAHEKNLCSHGHGFQKEWFAAAHPPASVEEHRQLGEAGASLGNLSSGLSYPLIMSLCDRSPVKA